MMAYRTGSGPAALALLALTTSSALRTHAASILDPNDTPAAALSDAPTPTNRPMDNVQAPPTLLLGTVLSPLSPTSPPPADAAWEATDPGQVALSVEQIDLLVHRIRDAHEEGLPQVEFDAMRDKAFLKDTRPPLDASKMPLPSTNPDDYEKRQYKDGQLIGGQKAPLAPKEGTLSLTEIDGKTFYTYCDPNGVILYQGPVDSLEDRANIPFQVWKKFYEIEQDAHPPPRHPPAP